MSGVDDIDRASRDRWNTAVNKQEDDIRTLIDLLVERCPALASAIYYKAISLHDSAMIIGDGQKDQVQAAASQALADLRRETFALLKVFVREGQ